MRKYLHIFITILFGSAIMSSALAQPNTLASAGASQHPAIKNLPVGRCLNMANHLEPPTEGDWGRRLADDDFEIIAKAGFTTVRLPVRWSGHAMIAAPYTIDAAFMARVKQVVSAARKAGLNIIINNHNYDALHTDPQGNQDRLAGLWRQVAMQFADEPRDHVWFEIQNEPHDKITNANLNMTLAPALAAIRHSNPDRPVVIGGEFWSGINSLTTLTLPDDRYTVPTFHYYDPFDFTHQGAAWINPVPPTGRKFGSKADKAALASDVQKVRDYIARTGKTPFMGEFGANELIPVGERVAYQKAVRIAFDGIGTGMCAWGFTNTFPLYNSIKKQWVPGMLDAMGLIEP